MHVTIMIIYSVTHQMNILEIERLIVPFVLNPACKNGKTFIFKIL